MFNNNMVEGDFPNDHKEGVAGATRPIQLESQFNIDQPGLVDDKSSESQDFEDSRHSIDIDKYIDNFRIRLDDNSTMDPQSQ